MQILEGYAEFESFCLHCGVIILPPSQPRFLTHGAAAVLLLGANMSRKPKVKWSDRINNDLLECKRRPKELTSSQDPLCKANGKKKGYIIVMKELWEQKGYGHLGLKGQNLRDQASRLEKAQVKNVLWI